MADFLVTNGNCEHCGAARCLWVQNRFCSLGCEHCHGSGHLVTEVCSDACKRRHIKEMLRPTRFVFAELKGPDHG